MQIIFNAYLVIAFWSTIHGSWKILTILQTLRDNGLYYIILIYYLLILFIYLFNINFINFIYLIFINISYIILIHVHTRFSVR